MENKPEIAMAGLLIFSLEIGNIFLKYLNYFRNRSIIKQTNIRGACETG